MVSELFVLNKAYTACLSHSLCAQMSIPLTQLAFQANPYPDYAHYRQQAPFVWDDSASCWVASQAAVVNAVLHSQDCGVRPIGEAIPIAIQGSHAGAIFAQLVRMNEGGAHQVAKAALMQSLATINSVQLSELMRRENFFLSTVPQEGIELNEWTFALPVRTMAMILGFNTAESQLLAHEIRSFVACLSALSGPTQLHEASAAAARLQQSMQRLVESHGNDAASFVFALQTSAREHGWHSHSALIANMIGVLSQTYEATAALLGNAIVQLHQQAEWRAQLQQQCASEEPIASSNLAAFITEVARFDPAIHSTRRYVLQDCRIAGQELRAGTIIVLLLAAANRDETLHSDAESFNPCREQAAQWGFSAGRHTCPGQQIALEIVQQAARYLLTHWSKSQWQNLSWEYKPSLNARIPHFSQSSKLSKKEPS